MPARRYHAGVVVRVGWMASGALVAAACGRGPFLTLATDDEGDDAMESDSGEPEDDCDLDSHRRDTDGDGIPDADDPFCMDRARPGRARADVVYAHSSSNLYTIDVRNGFASELVGTFTVDGSPAPQMTDIAIDRFGALYSITFGDLHACDPATAECWVLGYLPTNSLGFAPMGVIDDDDDTLVTLAGSVWMHVGLRGPELTPLEVASAQPYSSSGDVVVTSDGTALFTSPSSSGEDVVVAIESQTGALVGEVGPATGALNAYGIAVFDDTVWIFDSVAQIIRFDPQAGVATFAAAGPEGFWGAAAHPGD